MSAKKRISLSYIAVFIAIFAIILAIKLPGWWSDPRSGVAWVLEVLILITASVALSPITYRVMKLVVWLYANIGTLLARIVMSLSAALAHEQGKSTEEWLDHPMFTWLVSYMRFGSDRRSVERALTPRQIVQWIVYGWPIFLLPLILEETLPFFLILVGLAPVLARQSKRSAKLVDRTIDQAFNGRFRIRRATLADITQLQKVEVSVWEGITTTPNVFTGEQFVAQITRAPEFFFVAENKRTGEIVGYLTGLLADIPLDQLDNAVTTWAAACENGWYSNHLPNGSCYFGASLSVTPSAERKGLGDRLVNRGMEELVRQGIAYAYLGSRLPGMRHWLEQNPGKDAQDYFELRRDDGTAYDPELRYYARDMQVRKLLPDYFPDYESCDHGALVVWPNPLHKKVPRAIGVSIFKAMVQVYGLID